MASKLRSSSLAVLLVALGACESDPGQKSGDDSGTRPVGREGDGGSDGGRNGDGSWSPDGSTTRTDGAVLDSDAGPICEVVRLTAQARYPEILIVQDISGSMAGERWNNTLPALEQMATNLQDRLMLGLYLFPQTNAQANNECNLQAFPSGQHVHVSTALHNADAIAAALDSTNPFGGTPTAEALSVVHSYLLHQSSAPAGTARYVLLATDGSPNCTPPEGDGDNPDHKPSQQATLQEITSLANDGIKTYVVGYDIASSLQPVMNGWAAAGQGQSSYINVTNRSTLEDALNSIANAVVSCDYSLNAAPADASYVRVTLDGTQLALGNANGWSLVGSQTIQLLGTSCTILRDGRSHTLNAEVECAPVPSPN